MVWDREAGTITGRPGAQRLAVTSGGTIPDRGLYGVFIIGTEETARGGRRSVPMRFSVVAISVTNTGAKNMFTTGTRQPTHSTQRRRESVVPARR